MIIDEWRKVGDCMLRRLFHAWGIGAGRIKLVLTKDTWKQGEWLQGYIRVTGGSEPFQDVRVELMMTLVTMRGREYTRTVLTCFEEQCMNLTKGEKSNFIFSYQIPETIAISSNHIMYSLRLHTLSGHEDSKLIDIVPNEPLRQVIRALYNLDFRRDPSFGFFDGSVQYFKFVPTGYFMRMLLSVTFLAVPYKHEIRLFMYIRDNKGKDLYHMSKFLHWEWDEMELLTERLRKEITDMCNEPDSYLNKVDWVEEGAVGSLAKNLFPEVKELSEWNVK